MRGASKRGRAGGVKGACCGVQRRPARPGHASGHAQRPARRDLRRATEGLGSTGSKSRLGAPTRSGQAVARCEGCVSTSVKLKWKATQAIRFRRYSPDWQLNRAHTASQLAPKPARARQKAQHPPATPPRAKGLRLRAARAAQRWPSKKSRPSPPHGARRTAGGARGAARLPGAAPAPRGHKKADAHKLHTDARPTSHRPQAKTLTRWPLP